MGLQTHINQKRDLRTQSQIIEDQQKNIQQLTKYANDVTQALQRQNEQLNHYQTLDYRRAQVNQAVSFAVDSFNLQGGDFSVDSIMKTAKEFYEAIEAETTRLFEADKAEYEAKQEKERQDKQAQDNQSVEHDTQMNG